MKNGIKCNDQRYKCNACGRDFMNGDKRVKYGIKDKLEVIKLYLENCWIRTKA